MNTSRIGFIGLPDVASRFEGEGFSVITGETVLASAQAIRRAISEGTDSPLPVVVEDQHQSGLAGLLTRLQRAAGAIVIVRSGEEVLPRDWDDLPLESTLLEYATAAGVDAPSSLGLLSVQPDGSIIEREPDPEPAEPSLEDIDFDEPDAAPGLEDIDFDDPAPAPAPSADEDDDPFAEDDAPAEPVSAPTPQASLSEDLFVDAPARVEKDDLRGVGASVAPLRPVSPTPTPEDEDLDAAMSESEIGRPDTESVAPPRRTISRHEETELSPSALEQEIAETEAPGRPVDETPAAAGRRRRVVPAPVASPSMEDEEIRRETDDFLSEVGQGDDEDPDLRDDLDDDDDDDDMLLGRKARKTVRSRARASRGRAPVVINSAGKGGVGKTSISIAEGQRAAVRGRMDVCVIDMNRGQGDVSGFLKLRKSDLPTIFEAAQIGDLTKAFIPPSRLEAVRGDNVERIEFTVVSAPRAKHAEASRSVVTDRIYRQVIDYARDNFDLVIVDTQIVEATDTSGLIEGVVIPLLADGAYLVGITDQSRTGTDNLVDHIFRKFPEVGERNHSGAITSRNFMTIVNRMSREVDSAGFERKFGKMSHFAGAIPHDDRVRDLMNAGQVPHDIPSVARALDTVLYRVTGDDEFHPDASRGGDEEEGGAEKVGFFQRLFGRR